MWNTVRQEDQAPPLMRTQAHPACDASGDSRTLSQHVAGMMDKLQPWDKRPSWYFTGWDQSGAALVWNRGEAQIWVKNHQYDGGWGWECVDSRQVFGEIPEENLSMAERIERQNAVIQAEAAASKEKAAAADAAKSAAKAEAASRINAALNTLREEGLDLPRWLVMKVDRKGNLIAFGADRTEELKTLERMALKLCESNKGQVELEDAVADVFGLLEG